MRLQVLIVIFLFSIINDLHGQDKLDLNQQPSYANINVNAFGDASMISLNYEHFFRLNQYTKLSIKLGLGQNRIQHICGIDCPLRSIEKLITIPHHVIIILDAAHHKKKRAYFEFGVGATYVFRGHGPHYLIYPIFGYRFYPIKSLKVQYRVYTHLPYNLVRFSNFDGYFIPFGTSLGYTF